MPTPLLPAELQCQTVHLESPPGVRVSLQFQQELRLRL